MSDSGNDSPDHTGPGSGSTPSTSQGRSPLNQPHEAAAAPTDVEDAPSGIPADLVNLGSGKSNPLYDSSEAINLAALDDAIDPQHHLATVVAAGDAASAAGPPSTRHQQLLLLHHQQRQQQQQPHQGYAAHPAMASDAGAAASFAGAPSLGVPFSTENPTLDFHPFMSHHGTPTPLPNSITPASSTMSLTELGMTMGMDFAGDQSSGTLRFGQRSRRGSGNGSGVVDGATDLDQAIAAAFPHLLATASGSPHGSLRGFSLSSSPSGTLGSAGSASRQRSSLTDLFSHTETTAAPPPPPASATAAAAAFSAGRERNQSIKNDAGNDAEGQGRRGGAAGRQKRRNSTGGGTRSKRAPTSRTDSSNDGSESESAMRAASHNVRGVDASGPATLPGKGSAQDAPMFSQGSVALLPSALPVKGATLKLTFAAMATDAAMMLLDAAGRPLQGLAFAVDADKGFNYSAVDDAFICQKKNHFQLSYLVKMPTTPVSVVTPGGTEALRSLVVDVYGMRVEVPHTRVAIEQSLPDRSKRDFEPIPAQVASGNSKKTKVARLHFSETTANNMRKRGKPNPEQRYFVLVCGLYAVTASDMRHEVARVRSQRIIVRASNPGQYESETELQWRSGANENTIVFDGNVGINTESPTEALAVHGNIRLTGQVMQTSDARVKENIQPTDTRIQLENLRRMHLYSYDLKKNWMETAGRPEHQRRETGILAQELREILPDAVAESGRVQLADGEEVDNLLVVNKERVFMESVGAVQELSHMTETLEARIRELEQLNNGICRSSSLRRRGSSHRRRAGGKVAPEAVAGEGSLKSGATAHMLGAALDSSATDAGDNEDPFEDYGFGLGGPNAGGLIFTGARAPNKDYLERNNPRDPPPPFPWLKMGAWLTVIILLAAVLSIGAVILVTRSHHDEPDRGNTVASTTSSSSAASAISTLTTTLAPLTSSSTPPAAPTTVARGVQCLDGSYRSSSSNCPDRITFSFAESFSLVQNYQVDYRAALVRYLSDIMEVSLTRIQGLQVLPGSIQNIFFLEPATSTSQPSAAEAAFALGGAVLTNSLNFTFRGTRFHTVPSSWRLGSVPFIPGQPTEAQQTTSMATSAATLARTTTTTSKAAVASSTSTSTTLPPTGSATTSTSGDSGNGTLPIATNTPPSQRTDNGSSCDVGCGAAEYCDNGVCNCIYGEDDLGECYGYYEDFCRNECVEPFAICDMPTPAPTTSVCLCRKGWGGSSCDAVTEDNNYLANIAVYFTTASVEVEGTAYALDLTEYAFNVTQHDSTAASAPFILHTPRYNQNAAVFLTRVRFERGREASLLQSSRVPSWLPTSPFCYFIVAIFPSLPLSFNPQWNIDYCNSGTAEKLVEEGSAVPISETPLIYAFAGSSVQLTVAVSSPNMPMQYRFYDIVVSWGC
jgi:hypothetical protein